MTNDADELRSRAAHPAARVQADHPVIEWPELARWWRIDRGWDDALIAYAEAVGWAQVAREARYADRIARKLSVLRGRRAPVEGIVQVEVPRPHARGFYVAISQDDDLGVEQSYTASLVDLAACGFLGGWDDDPKVVGS